MAVAYTVRKSQLSELLIKAADDVDSSFEQSFSNIAHAFLQDKAPSLLDYELGFQMLDRNEDSTRAVGVFAFKVGGQILYAPVFFLNGDLKGYELLYMKNQDMFVPISEAWLNHIVNKKPISLGENADSDLNAQSINSPNLSGITNSPIKTAADARSMEKVAEFTRDFMPFYKAAATANIEQASDELGKLLGDRLNVDELMKQADAQMFSNLMEHVDRDVRVAVAFRQWYDLEKVAAELNRAELKAAHKGTLLDERFKLPLNKRANLLDVDTPDVEVYESKYDIPSDSSDLEIQVFFERGIFVRDKRKPADLSKVIDDKTDLAFLSPAEAGKYQVLSANGDLVEKIVLPRQKDFRSTKSQAWVLEPGKTSCCSDCSVNAQAVLAVNSADDATIGYRKWFDDLPDSLELERGNQYVFCNRDGQATAAICIKRSLGTNSDGLTTYVVDRWGSFESNRKDSPFGKDRGVKQDFPTEVPQLLIVGHKVGSKISVASGRMNIPAQAKKLSVSYSDGDSFVPGDLRDVRRRMMRSSTKVTAVRDGKTYTLDGDIRLEKSAAVKHLMLTHKMAGDDALELLAKTGKPGDVLNNRGQATMYLLKQADSPYLSDNKLENAVTFPEGVNQGNLMNFDGPVADNFTGAVPVPALAASNYSKDGYKYNRGQLEQELKNHISTAAQTGQKDVFDVGMLGSMLMIASDDRLIDQWIPDLIKGMDRLGRLMFLFYWHYDKFEDRFGKQDLPELEDFLRTSFDILGKLILFLKNKTVEATPAEGDMDIGLRGSI